MPLKRIAYGIVALMVLTALAAYFVRPIAPTTDLVSPKEELPYFQGHLPDDSGLANRVAKSYGLAFILIQSPYTQKNAIALDGVRTWARERFQHDPDFLHPVSLEPVNERRHTLIEAITYNLFTAPRFELEGLAGQYLKNQIERFHQSRAYQSFRNSYFDLFGWESDSAALLARYESEKAILAEGVVLWSVFWLVAVCTAIASLWRTPKRKRFEKLRLCLAWGWILLSGCYLARAWVENKVSVLVSSLICAALGLYLKYPLAATKEEESGRLSVRFIQLESNQVALASWLSASAVAIQALTWIRTGSTDDLDPVTLILCSLSGNFLHDPVAAKRVISRVVALLWILVSIWAARQSSGNAQEYIETNEKLAKLASPGSLTGSFRA